MYVVITSHDDDQLSHVEKYLDEPFVVLDTRDILRNKACSFSIKNGKPVVTKDGKQLKNVRSVWYRRLLLVQGFELPVAEEKRKYAQDAIRYFNRLIFGQFTGAFWVSDFFAVEKAADKLLQLEVAARHGFKVPETLVTTSANEARAFVHKHKSAIAKPNYSARYQHNGEEYIIYTSRVDKNTDFSGLHLAPAILQEAIEVKLELRITVVGDVVFAASVSADTAGYAGHIRDWRVAGTDETTIQAFELPKKVQDRCVAVVKDLGLQYGAIDVIVDNQNRYWFLENNPIGQWLFVQQATGLPIGKAIAELLERG